MAATDDEVKTTLSLIESTKLPHPSNLLLKSFVSNALNPVLAARYVKYRLLAGDASSLVDDWSYIVESITHNGSPPSRPHITQQHTITKRDGGKCCITGKAGTLRDPLIVAPILPVPSGWDTDKDNINDMLGAFLGLSCRDWWLSYIRNPRGMFPYCNHWLVRKSAAEAFASGLVKLNRLLPSMIEYELKQVSIGPEELIEVDGDYPLLGDHSRSGLSKVDYRFIDSQARLCESIQLFNISKRLSLETISRSPIQSTGLLAWHQSITQRNRWRLSSFCIDAFFTVWRLVPSKARIACYKILRKLARRLYGNLDDYADAKRLPFGLYLRYNDEADSARNEFNALGIVRRHTSIPVPKAVDIIFEQGDVDDPSSIPGAYILTTRVPGLPIFLCQNVLSDSDLERIAHQLKDYVAQLRDIPRLAKSGTVGTISNTLGEACRDSRIRGTNPVGPFADEAAFNQVLRFPDDPARRGHKIVFTHTNLNPRNILIDQTVQLDGSVGWSVTGIIDWEFAGYYPEYWDYTKSMFEGFRWSLRYNNMVKGVFSEFKDYSQELDVEVRSWESGDGDGD
ncbi:uncharacterized protein GGS22DRAFT_184933 [Annulohypoxylon maeteangense]|uniref:uncharacterized protein n=1 Tax=Annulohypoxylon maeteangense TaxID=1927788 RepID=UPI0020081980|nr:uncharacterized protein GGS22DRAFT_184933 [Annulohypoxylon maeteangense]KAI0889355.1 hypothetical protein GGS22DRAFT_184933 [Annulohypoxylon maeteangense]